MSKCTKSPMAWSIYLWSGNRYSQMDAHNHHLLSSKGLGVPATSPYVLLRTSIRGPLPVLLPVSVEVPHPPLPLVNVQLLMGIARSLRMHPTVLPGCHPVSVDTAVPLWRTT